VENRRGEGLNAPTIDLVSDDCSASISLFGGEAVSWLVSGRELLWSRTSSHWDRVAPVLFPCVGWSRDGRIQVGGESYPMPVHGFAPSSLFELVQRDADSAMLQLRETPDTLACYPFPFRLTVRYALSGGVLRVSVEVANTGAGDLPYACGLHPGFAWPFAGGRREDYRIEFADVESRGVPMIAAGGLFSSRTRAVSFDGRTLPLGGNLFANEALCFLNARSRKVSFAGPEGSIVAEADGFNHWALWSRPDAPFLCIEAWTGHGDPEGFTGEFADKPSLDHLKPGETRRHDLALSWRAR
jgi:galactose mutarotase-like enzyme